MKLSRKLKSAGKNLLVAWYAFRHPSTPLHGKIALMAMAIYLVSPVDLIPDIFPVLGWLDDAALVSFVLPVLLQLLPARVLKESQHMSESWLLRIFNLRKH